MSFFQISLSPIEYRCKTASIPLPVNTLVMALHAPQHSDEPIGRSSRPWAVCSSVLVGNRGKGRTKQKYSYPSVTCVSGKTSRHPFAETQNLEATRDCATHKAVPEEWENTTTINTAQQGDPAKGTTRRFHYETAFISQPIWNRWRLTVISRHIKREKREANQLQTLFLLQSPIFPFLPPNSPFPIVLRTSFSQFFFRFFLSNPAYLHLLPQPTPILYVFTLNWN